MFYKLPLVLLFIGLTARYSASGTANGSDVTAPLTNFRTYDDSEPFVLVNPNHLPHLEKTLQTFFTRLAAPIRERITLRSTVSSKNNLQRTIRQICDSIRQKLIEFAKSCGLAATVRSFERSSFDAAISEDWFSEVLIQGSRMLYDLSNMNQEVWSSVDLYLSQRNMSLNRHKKSSRHREFQFLGAVTDITDLSESLSECLRRSTSKGKTATFSLNQIFLNLTRVAPTSFLNTLKSNFNRISLDRSSTDESLKAQRLHVFLCRSMIDDKNDRFGECVEELRLLDDCLLRGNRRSSDGNSDNKTSARLWSRAIKDLSDCKSHVRNDGQVYVSCKTRGKIPRSTQRKVKYIYEGILDRQIPRKSALHRVANQLATVLSRTVWGKKFVNELCQYLVIYQDGRTKLERLSRTAATSRKALARYERVSEALTLYRRSLLLRTVDAINRIHRTTTDLERFFIQGIKVALNETWQSHIKILSCLAEWMCKLLELYGGVEKDGRETELLTPTGESAAIAESDGNTDSYNDESPERYDRHNGLQNPALPRSRNDKRKEADVALRNLMKSMNRASRFRRTYDKSMLACLANNLLLAAMFMETIGFVSTLFCLGHDSSKNQVNSLEIRDDWNGGRRRRSPVSLEYPQYLYFERTSREDTAPQIDDKYNLQQAEVFWNSLNYSALETAEFSYNNAENNRSVTKYIFLEQ